MRLLFAILSLVSLFSYGVSYPVALKSCDKGQIFVLYQNETIEISLFNLRLNEKGKEKICSLIQKEKDLKIEIDSSSALTQPLPVYLFVKNDLIQEKLVSLNMANIAIANPEYKYTRKMEEAKNSIKTIAESKETVIIKGSRHRIGWIFLVSLITLWFLLFYLIFRDKLRLHLS
ncbi:MAG: hypothetical protein RSA06_03600 [Erysipelotrichaceae bacterium]